MVNHPTIDTLVTYVKLRGSTLFIKGFTTPAGNERIIDLVDSLEQQVKELAPTEIFREYGVDNAGPSS